MQLRQLEYFATIARLGSFRRAAQELLVSQPTLSQQIKTLERRLGVPLLQRGSRAVTLTAAGQVFLDRVQPLLQQLQAAEEELGAFTELQIGDLRVGTLGATSLHGIPALLAEFGRRYPNVHVGLHEGTSWVLLDQVASGELDAALVVVPAAGASLPGAVRIERLRTYDVLLAVSPEHALAVKTALLLEDVRDQPMVVPPKTSARTWSWNGPCAHAATR